MSHNPQGQWYAQHMAGAYYRIAQIMAQVFISFQQLFTTATKRDWQLYETGVH